MQGSVKSVSLASRFICGLFIVAAALLLVVAGWTVPFQFESSSILYKFGMQKALLRSGKVVGITVVLLLFYQIVLASHIQYLERVFSKKLLSTLHRFNGFLITVLVLTHPFLVKASENFVSYTFEKKYYPEFVGILFFLVVLMVSMPAILRKHFGLVSGKKWLFLHRLGATLAISILPFHVLWVSDTFKSGLPRTAALVIFGVNILVILRIWLRRARL